MGHLGGQRPLQGALRHGEAGCEQTEGEDERKKSEAAHGRVV
jgi:hypothetical protein